MQINLDVLQGATPQLNSAKSILSNARAIISGITIPADFPEGSVIKAVAGKISSIEGMLSNANSSVSESFNKFQTMKNKNNSIVDNLFSDFLKDSKTNDLSSKKGKTKDNSKYFGKVEKKSNVKVGKAKASVSIKDNSKYYGKIVTKSELALRKFMHIVNSNNENNSNVKDGNTSGKTKHNSKYYGKVEKVDLFYSTMEHPAITRGDLVSVWSKRWYNHIKEI